MQVVNAMMSSMNTMPASALKKKHKILKNCVFRTDFGVKNVK
jgi:hypothetical protein